jgi:hypothetical protein
LAALCIAPTTKPTWWNPPTGDQVRAIEPIADVFTKSVSAHHSREGGFLNRSADERSGKADDMMRAR